ncbi:MAG: hypothetical protein J6T99_06040 [Oscillospiraceae bacterium]|nr:hypothetical protein [Oscillospiraceae bacterium]MBO7727080.1 hypothetical protein [Oscillospiraceae bacterium]
MENQIFREKSLERLSSPEELNDYLHVTNPAIWVVLVAVILLLSGLLIWSSFTAIESSVAGTAVADKGVLTVTFEDEKKEQKIEPGMEVTVGNTCVEIISVTTDENGRRTAMATANLPDGVYDAKVGYQSTRILHLLFN